MNKSFVKIFLTEIYKRHVMVRFITLSILQVIIFDHAFAQSSRELIHEGNKLYDQKKYGEAEVDYRKSLNTKENSFIGNYNLGNTYYQQGKYDEAMQQFQMAAGEKSVNKDLCTKYKIHGVSEYVNTSPKKDNPPCHIKIL